MQKKKKVCLLKKMFEQKDSEILTLRKFIKTFPTKEDV